jgi:hypothetical protein
VASCAPAISCLCSTTTKPTDVTAFRLKDVTGAIRARRYRERRKLNETNTAVTVDARSRHAITTAQMCALAARLSDGRASRDDLQLADRLIMALVDRLPPDSILELEGNYHDD